MAEGDNQQVGRLGTLRTVELTAQDVDDVLRLAHVLVGAELKPEPAAFLNHVDLSLDHAELVRCARNYTRVRHLRQSQFPRSMFGEPPWEILVCLYTSEDFTDLSTISKIAEECQVPLTSATRWIEYLEKEKSVERRADPDDARRVIIQLTQKGRMALNAFFSEACSLRGSGL